MSSNISSNRMYKIYKLKKKKAEIYIACKIVGYRGGRGDSFGFRLVKAYWKKLFLNLVVLHRSLPRGQQGEWSTMGVGGAPADVVGPGQAAFPFMLWIGGMYLLPHPLRGIQVPDQAEMQQVV